MRTGRARYSGLCALLDGDMVVGGCRFPQAMVGVIQLPPEYPNRPNVGSGLLKNFVVTLDQANARVRLAHDEPCVIEAPQAPAHAPAATGL